MGGETKRRRSAHRGARHESLDVAFSLREAELAGSASEATRFEREPFVPAQRVRRVLHAVAAAVSRIPFGDVRGVEIRGITQLEVERDVSLEPPLEVRAHAVGPRELTAGRELVAIQCKLTNQLGDCVARFSIETEAAAEPPRDTLELGIAPDSVASDPDIECVDNIPV